MRQKRWAQSYDSMRVIYLFLFCISTNVALPAQPNAKWSLQDSTTYPLSELIDSIWNDVVSWDRDSSMIALQLREEYSLRLDQFGERGLTSDHDKALLFSFFIRLRNHDYTRILERFYGIESRPKLFADVYPIFKKAMISVHGEEVAYYKLDSLANSLNCPSCKVKIWSDLGTSIFFKDGSKKSREYFIKAITTSDQENLPPSRDLIRAQSFLRRIDELSIGDLMKPFATRDINGNPVELTPQDSIVTLIEFWATWCSPCLAELPTLRRIYKKHGNNPRFRIIGVSLDKNIDDLKDFVFSKDIPWRQIYEEVKTGKQRDGVIVTLYNGYALPTYYIIDKEGFIRYNYDSRENEVDMETLIDELLSK